MILVIVSFLVWAIYYFLIHTLNIKRSAEWNSRVVALTHAVIATKCVETCLYIGPWPFDNFGEPNTEFQTLTISNSAGYFIFESIWCVIMKTEGVVMMLHHFISVVALIGALIIDKSGSEVTAVLWGSELTNPFLQIRWFLRETKQYHTTFAFLNDCMLFIFFALVRLGVGTCLAYSFYFSTKSPFLLKVGGYVFYLISIFWMWQISMFAKRRFLAYKRNNIKLCMKD